MFICIYAISVFPVVSIDLFIKPQSDLSKAERNVHNRGMEVIDNNQKQHSKGLSWKNVRFNLRDLCFTDRMRWFVYRITRGTNQGSMQFL